jgi:hypothetical protein
MSRLLALLQEVSTDPEARAKYRGRTGEHRDAFIALMRAYQLTDEEQRAVLQSDDDDNDTEGFERIELEDIAPRNGNVHAYGDPIIHSYRDLR